MLLSGLFTSLFGLGYFWNIHVLWYFVLVQVRAPVLHSDLCSIVGRVVEAASVVGWGCWGLGRAPQPRRGQREPAAWPRPVPLISSLPADLQRTCPDHRLALCGDLRWQLVRKGKVSVQREEEREVGREGCGE